MKAEEKKKAITIQSLRIGKIKVPLKGKTPLLMDRFPEEAKEAILAKQSGISKSNKKKIRDTKGLCLTSHENFDISGTLNTIQAKS